MINLPTHAEVHCSDGPAGRFTHVIGNPTKHEITHLVVKSYLPPFHEYLVPVDQIKETTPDWIKLKCTRDDLNQMKPFELEEYLPSALPDYMDWPYDAFVGPWDRMKEQVPYTPVKRENVPPGELALQRGARVEATDGYLGQVDELLIDSTNMRVTHVVLLEKHIFQKREITIPVSQIDHSDKDIIYLKLDRQSVKELPTTPIQRWSR